MEGSRRDPKKVKPEIVSDCHGVDTYMAKAFYERCNPWHVPLERRCTQCHQVCNLVAEDEDEIEPEEPLMDEETAGDMKYHALKDEGLLDKFGRRKDKYE